MLFGHGIRLIEKPMIKVNQMEDSPIREVKEPKLILGQTIKERTCSK